ncbi:MAG: VIT1/CCC1 transporter family protein [Desulfovibrio fairfieldensis]
MESGETEAVEGYKAISEQFPIARKILEDESRHEEELAAMIEEDGLSYISSMVLGLNDALVELTGALAGFTLALNDNKMIGLAGFITGVAATLSMAASEYLSKKTDSGEKHPLKAAVYTGLAYLFTVALLLAPYIIFSAPLVSLAFCLLIAALIILGFTYFVSVVRKSSFLHGFREMLTISFSVALISFLIGWGARAWLQIEI